MLRAVLVALTSGLLFLLAVPQIGPAISAARADGTPGVFKAQRVDCVQHPGHRQCRWTGWFRADDGSVNRNGVTLYGSGKDSLQPGTETRAVDTGRANRVYGPDGSREWIFTALMLLLATAILFFGLVRPSVRRLRRLDTSPVRTRTPVG